MKAAKRHRPPHRDTGVADAKEGHSGLTMRVLIVEDEIHVATALAESVRRQGHEVMVARSVQEAISLVAQWRPEGILLDIVMPGVSGIHLLRRIRETDPVLPVVVITGRASPEEIEAARHLGVAEVIQKPFALERLDEALKSLGAERL